MTTKEIISDALPVLTLQDTVQRALAMMNECKVMHLPVLVDNKVLTIVAEDEMLDEDETLQLKDIHLREFKPQVMQDAHVLDASKIMAEFQLSLLPVVDAEQHFVGSILAESLLRYLSTGTQSHENGGIILLEIDPRNYSLSEIARICESDNVNILSVLQHTNKETGMLYITLKTNRQDLNSVIASFERFNYHVLGVFAESYDKEIIKSNYDLLMHYINM